jgi:hypothetical protein
MDDPSFKLKWDKVPKKSLRNPHALHPPSRKLPKKIKQQRKKNIEDEVVEMYKLSRHGNKRFMKKAGDITTVIGYLIARI